MRTTSAELFQFQILIFKLILLLNHHVIIYFCISLPENKRKNNKMSLKSIDTTIKSYKKHIINIKNMINVRDIVNIIELEKKIEVEKKKSEIFNEKL